MVLFQHRPELVFTQISELFALIAMDLGPKVDRRGAGGDKRRAAELLVGRRVGELSAGGATLGEVGRAAMDESEPIDDLRGSAAYRRHLVRTLTERAVSAAIAARIDAPDIR